MDVSLSQAATAYANRMQAQMDGTEDEADAGGAAPAGGGSFTDALSQVLNGAVATQNNAEAMQMQAATTGRIDTADLVTAVANAELSLTTVVAIRDRVIQAYQSIISMAI